MNSSSEVNRRMANIEEKIEKLATKENISNIRSEIGSIRNMIILLVGVLVTIVGGGLSWMISMQDQITENSTKIEIEFLRHHP